MYHLDYLWPHRQWATTEQFIVEQSQKFDLEPFFTEFSAKKLGGQPAYLNCKIAIQQINL